MKKKSWKKITLALIIIGCLFLVFSAFPILADYTPPSTSTNYTSPSINIDNWDIDIKNAEITEVISLDPNTLDQSQEIMNGYFKIGIGAYYWMAQSVKNDREPLTGFYVAVARHGKPTMGLLFPAPLYIGIIYPTSKSNPENPNNFNILGKITSEQLPENDKFYWMGLDLSSNPINIPPETFFHIVVISEAMDIGYQNYWMLGVTIGTDTSKDAYNRGVLGHWLFQKGWWECGDLSHCAYDMAFATYTVPGDNGNGNGGNGGGPPTITITSNHQVISQVLGLMSFIGAAISGIKFKWFI